MLQDDVGDFYENQNATQGCIKNELLGKLQSINEELDKPQIFEDKQLKPQDESSVVPAQPHNLYQQFLLKKKEEINKRLKKHKTEHLECDEQPWQSFKQQNEYLQRLQYEYFVHREYEDDEIETIQKQAEANYNNLINNT